VLATFVIGLREGLEAALIVGIIAAFLRKNGKSLTAMWLGVMLAVLLSIAVGVVLSLVEQALPQASQEAMESVIGAVAIFFVTGMIAWMNTHARGMKKELEAEAAQALTQGSAYALAGMAFLAVLKEGFETSVFLLATFSAAQSAVLAAAGAVIGLLVAVGIGWGIFVGGVKINLSKFFRFTGAFLILVAAGLVITALRSAHEAGWLNAGQQLTFNLSWLVAPGTVQSALITGVLGIPADPRLIEVIGWLAYLVPIALFVYWPQSRRPGQRATANLRLSIAAALAVVALGLAALYPTPRPQAPAQATIVAGAENSSHPLGTVQLNESADGSPAQLQVSLNGSKATTLALPEDGSRTEQHDGTEALAWDLDGTGTPANAPSTLTVDQIVALAGGRVPVGLNPVQHPGPFAAQWSTHRSARVWVADGVLLDAAEHSVTILTLSGSGLQAPRTLTVNDGGDDAVMGNWQVSATYRDQAVAALNAVAAAAVERLFWAVQVPILLVLVALLLAAFAGRSLIQLRRAPEAVAATSISKSGHRAIDPAAKGATRATH